MNAQINISRTILNQTEDKGEFIFLEGDYFNIYHGVPASESFMNDENFKKFLAFQVSKVDSNSIDIKILYPTAPETKDFCPKQV